MTGFVIKQLLNSDTMNNAASASEIELNVYTVSHTEPSSIEQRFSVMGVDLKLLRDTLQFVFQ